MEFPKEIVWEDIAGTNCVLPLWGAYELAYVPHWVEVGR